MRLRFQKSDISKFGQPTNPQTRIGQLKICGAGPEGVELEQRPEQLVQDLPLRINI